MNTARERFINALERRSPLPGLVPHFELVFFLTMEAFGKVSAGDRQYLQWDQMRSAERDLHRLDMVDMALSIAEKYEQDAIPVLPAPWRDEEVGILAEKLRERSGNEYCLVAQGDATLGVPGGDEMEEISFKLVDDPQSLKDWSMRRVERLLKHAAEWKKFGIDAVAMCSDYCMNAGPFLSPDLFAEFVAPYLKLQIEELRKLGLYTIKHSDGNILPIIDQILDCKPDALHSLDPQGGIDIREVKQKYGKQVCLIGNVNCGLMDTGTEEQVIASAEYALKYGMPGGGYIFSTSNCIYTGMPLKNYELILKVRREKGVYC